jgi:hypothetical protein
MEQVVHHYESECALDLGQGDGVQPVEPTDERVLVGLCRSTRSQAAAKEEQQDHNQIINHLEQAARPT